MKLRDLKVGDCYIHKLPGFSYMFEVEKLPNIDDPQGPWIVCKHFVAIYCTDNRFELEYKEHSVYFLLSGEDSDLCYIDKNEFYKYVALSRTTKTTFRSLIT